MRPDEFIGLAVYTEPIFIKLKYHALILSSMCEMIDDIEIEHLRMALTRARKEMHEEQTVEESLIAVAN